MEPHSAAAISPGAMGAMALRGMPATQKKTRSPAHMLVVAATAAPAAA